MARLSPWLTQLPTARTRTRAWNGIRLAKVTSAFRLYNVPGTLLTVENPTMRKMPWLLLVVLAPATGLAEDPVKHSSGRPLPKMPEIKKPVAFDTPEADKILEALQVFPADNPWN